MIKHDAIDHQAIYEERVAHRAVVYLETNIWIDLAQARTELAVETIELARLAQKSRTAIFPVSYASVTEFLRQGVNVVTRRQGHLMDDLSEFVTFRSLPFIADVEVQRVYDYMVSGEPRARPEQVFTATTEYLGNSTLEYPSGCREEI